MHGPMPLRPTPMAMILERAMGNSNNEELASDQNQNDTSDQHPNGHAIQIISDRGMSSCLNLEGMLVILRIGFVTISVDFCFPFFSRNGASMLN